MEKQVSPTTTNFNNNKQQQQKKNNQRKFIKKRIQKLSNKNQFPPNNSKYKDLSPILMNEEVFDDEEGEFINEQIEFDDQNEISDFENISPKLLAVNLEFDKKMAKMFLNSFSKDKAKTDDLISCSNNLLNTSKSLADISQDLLDKDIILTNTIQNSPSQLLLLLESNYYTKFFQEAEKNKNDPQQLYQIIQQLKEAFQNQQAQTTN